MSGIKYVTGDALDHPARLEHNHVIAHVCNNYGTWGAGFVVNLSKLSWYPEAVYKKYSSTAGLRLGDIQVVYIRPRLWVVNMIAQDMGPQPRIKYVPLQECLMKLERFMFDIGMDTELHIPRIGCGLGGGDWDQVRALLDLEIQGAVTVYDLTEADAARYAKVEK